MKQAITQRKAKVMIRDYLRETGRKGVTSLIRDIHRHTKKPIFSQRTLEKWLAKQDRFLQDENWEIVLDFICSEQFKKFVPDSNEGSAEKRLIKVADGFAALYSKTVNNNGFYLPPELIESQGQKAIKLLEGYWAQTTPISKNISYEGIICRIDAVPGKRYAKFAYFSLAGSRNISTTGIVIYLNSEEHEDYDFRHTFVLQLWRRKDPRTGSSMPGELRPFEIKSSKEKLEVTATKVEFEFIISSVINQYFYDETVTSNVLPSSTETLEGRGDAMSTWNMIPISLEPLKYAASKDLDNIDILIEDVLPHGYT